MGKRELLFQLYDGCHAYVILQFQIQGNKAGCAMLTRCGTDRRESVELNDFGARPHANDQSGNCVAHQRLVVDDKNTHGLPSFFFYMQQQA
jgi:hypothetical protein